MVMEMTLDDALRLFQDEISATETRILYRQERRNEIRRLYFGRLMTHDEEIRTLSFLITCDYELLKVLKNSRDRLVEEMVRAYL